MTHTPEMTPPGTLGPEPPPTRPIPPPGPPAPRRARGPMVAAAGVVLALLAGGAAVLASGAGPAENRYQRVASAGENPFTTPVGTDRPGLTPVAAGGDRRGDAAEMYLHDPERPACDGAALVSQLQADPAKAAAWAQVQRIAPARLPVYVQGLTAVVLRSDTAVVDHGYRAGTFVPVPAVLQTGTSVFVNSYGQPVVKCWSGDPLTPGASSDPAVTTVTPAAAPIATVTFHHPVTGGPVSRPGKPDSTGAGPAPAGPAPGAPAPGAPAPGGDTPTGTPPTGTPPTGTPPSGTEPLTGSFNYDGSVTLSDGRLQRVDGTIVTVPTRPPGSTRLNDGGWRDAAGVYYNQDGSRRRDVLVHGLGGNNDLVLTADGRYLDPNGDEVPLELDAMILRTYDGSVLYVYQSGTESVIVEVTSSSGTRRGEVYGRPPSTFDNGAIVTGDGRILNPIGTVRLEVTLPGGGKIGADGRNTPPPPSGTPTAPGTPGSPRPTTAPGAPKNGGVVGPRTNAPGVPTTVPIEREPARNGGVVPPGNGGIVGPTGDGGARPTNGGIVGPRVDTGTTGDTGESGGN